MLVCNLFRLCNKSPKFSRNLNYTSCKINKNSKWGNVVNDAERVIGYPTSFLSLRWILNDEIANIASHLRKLIGINHPLLKTVKNLLLRNELPTLGLVVLLISKAAGLNSNFTELEYDQTADILHSQRILAEVTEMIKTSHLIHKGLVNIEANSEYKDDLNFGNNLALLSGDYLLSTSFNEIARLKNFKVQYLMSTALRDLAESEFLGVRDKQNQPLPTEPLRKQESIEIPLEFDNTPFRIQPVLGNMKSEWILRNILSGGSLLGKSCQCSLILANHPEDVQHIGYEFGRNFILAWQASLDRHCLEQDKFSLISAPVMLHLEYDRGFYQEISNIDDVDNVDYDYLRRIINNGPGVDRTDQLLQEFSDKCLQNLEKFNDSESKLALINILKAL